MQKPPNRFHIFRCWAHGRLPWPLVVFERCSASLEAHVPLETPCTTHSLISICTSYHFKSLRSRFAKFHAEFDVCSLLQNHVHVKSQMWRHTWWQTLMLCISHCSHSDATQHTEWWRSLLPNIANAFTYCHWLAFYGTSLVTFWYTYIYHSFTQKDCICIEFKVPWIKTDTIHVHKYWAPCCQVSEFVQWHLVLMDPHNGTCFIVTLLAPTISRQLLDF